MLGLVLTSALAVATSADVQLKLTAVKSQILVGEFTKLRLQWTVLKPVSILDDSASVLIDDGTGFRKHIEATLEEITTVALPLAYEPGETLLTEYRVGLEPTGKGGSGLEGLAASVRFAFDHPGVYRVKVRYEQAESNEVQITVDAPRDRDAVLFQTLAAQPLLLTPLVRAEKPLDDLMESLISAYDAHPYLAPAILASWGSAVYRQDLFEQFRALDFGNSAFADEHLLLIAERGGRFLGEEFERQTLRDVIEKFPGSLAAKKAAILLDSEPPQLTLAAVPSTLWPPNHKLEPITVAVTVTDNVDPNPSVELVSIVCEDSAAHRPDQEGQGQPTSEGCDDDDIAEATYGTDDREFRLRSQRLGTGSGRVYTITYEASDASGNKATATRTVTIAHDQGIAKKK